MRGEKGGLPKPCCMISELLEETGVDREQLRRARRQVLEGVILLCQWQLSRLDGVRPPSARRAASPRRGRKITVE